MKKIFLSVAMLIASATPFSAFAYWSCNQSAPLAQFCGCFKQNCMNTFHNARTCSYPNLSFEFKHIGYSNICQQRGPNISVNECINGVTKYVNSCASYG